MKTSDFLCEARDTERLEALDMLPDPPELPCAYCGAEPDEPCSEECVEARKYVADEERSERIIERALRKRDAHWEAWLEKFSITIHEEFRQLHRRLDHQDANIALLGGQVRMQGKHLTLVESTLPPVAETR